MRGTETAEKDHSPGVTAAALWRVVAVSALPDSRLRFQFVVGTNGDVGMAGSLGREQVGVFAPQGDPAVLAQVSVELGAVSRPGEWYVEAEVLDLVDSLCPKPGTRMSTMTVEDIMALGCQGAALRIRDRRGDDVILGYGSDQEPG